MKHNYKLISVGVLALGLWIFFSISIKPLIQIIKAGSWESVPAVVTESRVEMITSRKTSYVMKLKAKYSYRLEQYNCSQYDFSDASSPLKGRKQKIIDSFPLGKKISVYINPKQPNQCVFNPKPDLYLVWGIMALYLTLLIFFSLRKTHATLIYNKYKIKYENEELTCLKQKQKLSHKFWMALSFVVFCYVAIITIFYQTPYILGYYIAHGIAALFVLNLAVKFLCLFNPIVSISVDKNPIQMDAQVEYMLEGKYKHIEHLSFSIFAVETRETRGQNGNVHVGSAEVYRAHLYQDKLKPVHQNGTFSIHIPPEEIQNLQGEGRVIRWYIEARGVIKMWPDMINQFPINIIIS
tara:strand:+ start:31304 stop:32359 length:1056 start_codon:yes stop_codon:yes gene_type:complete